MSTYTPSSYSLGDPRLHTEANADSAALEKALHDVIYVSIEYPETTEGAYLIPVLWDCDVVEIHLTAGTPGTGSATTIDAHRVDLSDGSDLGTIFTTQGNRPSLGTSDYAAKSGTPDGTSTLEPWDGTDGIALRIDVDAADSNGIVEDVVAAIHVERNDI